MTLFAIRCVFVDIVGAITLVFHEFLLCCFVLWGSGTMFSYPSCVLICFINQGVITILLTKTDPLANPKTNSLAKTKSESTHKV